MMEINKEIIYDGAESKYIRVSLPRFRCSQGRA